MGWLFSLIGGALAGFIWIGAIALFKFINNKRNGFYFCHIAQSIPGEDEDDGASLGSDYFIIRNAKTPEEAENQARMMWISEYGYTEDNDSEILYVDVIDILQN